MLVDPAHFPILPTCPRYESLARVITRNVFYFDVRSLSWTNGASPGASPGIRTRSIFVCNNSLVLSVEMPMGTLALIGHGMIYCST